MNIITEDLSSDQMWQLLEERANELAYLNSPDFNFHEYARRFPQFLIGGQS